MCFDFQIHSVVAFVAGAARALGFIVVSGSINSLYGWLPGVRALRVRRPGRGNSDSSTRSF